jgi:hypothetical protein
MVDCLSSLVVSEVPNELDTTHEVSCRMFAFLYRNNRSTQYDCRLRLVSDVMKYTGSAVLSERNSAQCDANTE